MAVRKKGLGKGLDSMFPSYASPFASNNKEETEEKEADQQVKEVIEEKSVSEEVADFYEDESVDEDIPEDTFDEVSETDDSSENMSSEEKNSVQQNENARKDGVVMLKLSDIEPNREQPRKEFAQNGLEELAGSIMQYGVIQPLIVQKREDYYEIIAGERRWRAAKLAGIKEVPVVIKDYTEQEIMEVSLIENIQREDLNPIEEALAYQRLLDEYEMRQEELAEKVSKNRTTITNALRLLKLDERVKQMLIDGLLTTGHARALLSLKDEELQYQAAEKIVTHKLSVREVEKLVKKLLEPQEEAPKVSAKAPVDDAMSLIYRDMEDHMKAIFGTKVSLNRKSGNKGKIEIEYYSTEELERIFDLLRSLKN